MKNILLVMISNRKLDPNDQGFAENFESEQYKRYTWMEYELFLQPHILEGYLSRLIKVQEIKGYEYYPISEKRFNSYIKLLSKDFNQDNLKYRTDDDLSNITKAISNLGRSGINYIRSVEKVIDVNKPVLLHYGIEHLSAFLLNLHFNFTEQNKRLNQIGDKLYKHGIDPYDFKKVTNNTSSKNFLESKIKFRKIGLAPRFFLILDLPFKRFFMEEMTTSLIDLMTTFFTRLPLGNPIKVSGEFTLENPDIDLGVTNFFGTLGQDVDLVVLYSLSFIFSYLSRYKIAAYEKFLNEEERTLGFYLRTILKRIQDLYIRKIFSIFFYNHDEILDKYREINR